ncbi:MAG: FAD-linked oxidase C-terminal domain-containing protein, partial [Armatimonadota bacterium]
VMISLTRMRRVINVDIRNRRITAEAGVINLKLSQHVAGDDYHYAPDPSSQMACTIGGNVAENAGGPHTLKYGVTTNHLLGAKMVLPTGEILEIFGETDEPLGYDLLGLITGSEGTFGIVTEVTVRLTRLPEAKHTALAVFETIDDATHCVSDIIAAGIVPAALEMMDSTIIEAVEAAFHFGFPLDASAVLIIELDGIAAGLDRLGSDVEAICLKNNAREVRVAGDETERANLWMARKKAVGTLGKLSPSHCTQDGVIPRSKLPQVLRRISAVAKSYDLRVANVFHAGDGNLHPILLYDDRDPDQVKRVIECGGEILKICVEVGGTITGEHGVGVEKMDFMSLIFTPVDLDTMARVRAVFNPQGLCNPDKVLPTTKGCVELLLAKRGVH